MGGQTAGVHLPRVLGRAGGQAEGGPDRLVVDREEDQPVSETAHGPRIAQVVAEDAVGRTR